MRSRRGPRRAGLPIAPMSIHQRRCATALRRCLDLGYAASGVVAASFLVGILLIVSAQMLARWSGVTFAGSTDYAGYCMAAASFFAFAYALNGGSHIRVSILLIALGRRRRWAEIWCLSVASLLAILWTHYAIKATWLSYRLNDISQGQDATPLWIPQLAMSIGSLIFAIALLDNLISIIVSGDSNILPDKD